MLHTGENTTCVGVPGCFRITKTMCPISHTVRKCQRSSDHKKAMKQEDKDTESGRDHLG